ncbi:hypothetical protein CcCBS67573_g10585, partial [Chytriomyces confervae]
MSKQEILLYNGSNYQEWEFGMRYHLNGKKIRFTLTEDKPAASAAAELKEWVAVDIQAMGKIVERILPKYYEHLREATTAKEMMDAVRDITAADEANLQYRSQTMLRGIKMEEGGNMIDHIGKLEEHRHVLRKKLVSDLDMINIVMRSLPQSWESSLQAIRTQSELLESYKKFKGKIIAEYEYGLVTIKTVSNSNMIAMQARQTNPPRFTGDCDNCGKRGHKKTDCWAKNSGKEGQGPYQRRERTMDDKQANQVTESRHYVLTVSKTGPRTGSWILDSGASNHMTGNKETLANWTPSSELGKVTVASGDELEINGAGSLDLQGPDRPVTITGVLYVPGLSVNLLSISALGTKGAAISFDGKGASVSIKGKIILRADEIEEGLYTIQGKQAGLATMVSDIRKLSTREAHRSMGHLNTRDLQKLPSLADGIKITDEELGDCDICTEAKTTRHVNKERSAKTETPGEEISVDLTFVNEIPILMVSDTGSGCTIAKILKKKSETPQAIADIVKIIEKQYNHQVKTVISDGGGEFVNKKMQDWCAALGIQHQTTTAYTPEQNGIAERKNRTIMETTRAMLLDAKLDKTKYWNYAFEMAVYIRNRCPTSSTTAEKTPCELLTGKQPNLKYIRPFGESCTAYVDQHKRDKFDAKGTKCRVLGIREKGYLLLEEGTERVFQSVHVKFANTKERGVEDLPDLLSDSEGEDEDNYDQPTRPRQQTNPRHPAPIWRGRQEPASTASRPSKDINSSVDSSNIIQASRRRAAYAFSAVLEDPRTTAEALDREDAPKWKDAILDELNSLVENGTWEMINLKQEPTENVADTKWVHKRKQDAAGVFEKYKSRL